MTTSVCRIVTATDLPTSVTFRPWCSSHLRRFHPRPTLRVYFTPQPPLGFTLQGISLLYSCDDSSPPLCLLVGSLVQAVCSCPHTPLTPSPPSRLSSVQKSVVKLTGVSRQLARSLPEFSLLQVLLSLSTPQEFYPLLPPIALSKVCRVIPLTGVQRFENRKPNSSLSRPADLLEVCACSYELAPARTRLAHSLQSTSTANY
jgi:hypothetical protein